MSLVNSLDITNTTSLTIGTKIAAIEYHTIGNVNLIGYGMYAGTYWDPVCGTTSNRYLLDDNRVLLDNQATFIEKDKLQAWCEENNLTLIYDGQDEFDFNS